MSELTVTSTYEGLRAIGPWLREIVEPLDDDVAAPLLARMELALQELGTNTVDHADSPDGSFVLRSTIGDDSVRIELRDRGRSTVDVSTIPTPDADEPQVRGYGMMIIEQLVSRLEYAHDGEHNVWTATFEIDHPASGPENSEH